MQDVKTKIIRRIKGKGRGTVYVSKDFLDLGSRAAVDQALSRRVKEQALRRIGRGLFDYPRVSPTLGGGQLSLDPDMVAGAIVRRQGGRLAPSGASAANVLGLSTQILAKRVYLTEGAPSRVQVGKQIITLKQVAPKRVSPTHRLSTTVFQALAHLGRDGVTDGVLDRLRATLSPADRRALLKESRYTTGWIAKLVRRLAIN